MANDVKMSFYLDLESKYTSGFLGGFQDLTMEIGFLGGFR